MKYVGMLVSLVVALLVGGYAGAKYWERKIDSILIPPADAPVALSEAEKIATAGYTLWRYKDEENGNVCYLYGQGVHCITTW